MPGQGYVRPKKLHVDPDEPLYLVCRRPAFAHSAMSSLKKSDSEVNQRCRRGERAPPPQARPQIVRKIVRADTREGRIASQVTGG